MIGFASEAIVGYVRRVELNDDLNRVFERRYQTCAREDPNGCQNGF